MYVVGAQCHGHLVSENIPDYNTDMSESTSHQVLLESDRSSQTLLNELPNLLSGLHFDINFHQCSQMSVLDIVRQFVVTRMNRCISSGTKVSPNN